MKVSEQDKCYSKVTDLAEANAKSTVSPMEWKLVRCVHTKLMQKS